MSSRHDFHDWKRAPTMRRFIRDGDGEPCEVYEMVSGAADAVRRVLVFNQFGRVRRVSRYPSGWATCTDEDLLAVSEGV